nr:NBS-containing resistance-like protein [Tanacetum cinerariifolium]
MPIEILTGNKLCVTNIKLSLTITPGSLNRYKARLGANGRSQQQGINCDTTFSHVVSPATIQIVLSLAVSRQWHIHQFSGYASIYFWILCFSCDNLVTCSSKRQDTLSHSSDEAEYRGVANVVAETSWIHNLLRELHTSLFTATLVYCDNVSAVYMSADPVQHQRTKHIEIDIQFVRDKVAVGHVRVPHVPSRFQYADIFIKGPSYPLFVDFISSLSVRKTPAPIARAY